MENNDVLHCIKVVLDDVGVEPNPENIAHLMVFMEALRVYDQRSRSYGMVWQQYGALSNLINASRKVDRLMAVWWSGAKQIIGRGQLPAIHKDYVDDAVDALNYLAFFLRNVRNHNFTGTTPTRPTMEDLKELLGK